MTIKTLNNKISLIVEQKLSEMLGDPDSFLPLNKDFVRKLKLRLNKPSKLIAHSQVLKKYGLR